MNFETIVTVILKKLFKTLSIKDVIELLGGQDRILDVFMNISDSLTDEQRKEFRDKFFGKIEFNCNRCEAFKERHED